ncbi:hypothetical protein GCM10007989_12220 [Devosia pacifica]|uniref:IclR-ED domain-containing protein n=2 Tax=Devosia pacifica TaxID=1335967 RepID=A0A918S187_9HYPH|nr:hypothetical protein GCM10007989_12220 [Devosia pacifica]
MLDRLVRRHYVRRTEQDRYMLSLKMFELAHRRPPLSRLVSAAMPAMRGFATMAQQSCHLVMRDRNMLVVVAQVDGPGYWSVSLRVGARLAVVGTGSGHVFLAYASEDERQQMLAEDNAQPLSEELEARLQRVRTSGFEEMPSQQVRGVTNLSVPIYGPLGSVIAVITCPFTERLDRDDAASPSAALKLLVDVGRDLSQRSGSGDS